MNMIAQRSYPERHEPSTQNGISHWPETAVFIGGPSVFASLSSPEQYSVYRRNPDKQLSLWIRNLCFLTHLFGRFCVDFLALNSCLFRSCIGSYFTSILAWKLMIFCARLKNLVRYRTEPALAGGHARHPPPGRSPINMSLENTVKLEK